MENKVKNVLSGIGFYGTLAVCLLVVGVCAGNPRGVSCAIEIKHFQNFIKF